MQQMRQLGACAPAWAEAGPSHAGVHALRCRRSRFTRSLTNSAGYATSVCCHTSLLQPPPPEASCTWPTTRAKRHFHRTPRLARHIYTPLSIFSPIIDSLDSFTPPGEGWPFTSGVNRTTELNNENKSVFFVCLFVSRCGLLGT